MATSAPPTPPRPIVSPWIALPLLAVMYGIPILATVRPVDDYDIWWHLRTGQWIVDNGKLPDHDPFTVYGSQQNWVAYSWGFELLAYELHTFWGLSGIVFFRVFLAVAVTAACHKLVDAREPRFLVSTTLTAIVALSLTPLLTERPWLLSIFFTTLTLDVALDLRAGRHTFWFWLLPPLYVLWATMHIQFVYGFMVLGLGCIAPYFDRAIGRPATDDARTPGTRDWRRLAWLTVACVLATLLTPYHVRLYAVVLEYATEAVPFRVIEELMAPEFRSFGEWFILGLGLLTLYCLGRMRSVSSFEFLFVVVGIVFFCRARRDLWLVALAALVVLPAALPRASASEIRFSWTWVRAVVGVILVVGVGVGIWAIRGLTETRCEEAVAERFPQRAAVHARALPGPIYNHLNWGGYLMWSLPDKQITIDGRTNLHGERRIERSLQVWSGRPDWKEDPELLRAKVIIAETDSPLTTLLTLDAKLQMFVPDGLRFEAVYSDKQATVFVRKR